MYPVPAKCPVCEDELYAERLVCTHCGSAIEGTFTLRRLSRLTAEQWDFVELFLRSEGKLNRVQDELNLSYPTVRNRLHEVIRALGYEPGGEETEDEDSEAVLEALSEGNISVDEAIRMLKGGHS